MPSYSPVSTSARISLAVGIAVLPLMACTSGEATEQQSPQERVRSKVDPGAVMAMERDQYRKTFDKLGRRQFDNANGLMQGAALAAAESDKCDRVSVVGISDRATRKELQWYVDCENKERFQVRQEQAEAARVKYDPASTPEQRLAVQRVAPPKPKSARWEHFNEPRAVVACAALVRSTMLDQGSFDSAWSYDSEKDDQTGIVKIQQDFEAKNGFGGTVSGRYHCEVDADHGSEIKKLRVRDANGWQSLL